MAKLQVWTPDQAKLELNKRLAYAKDIRKNLEKEWEESERAIYSTRNSSLSSLGSLMATGEGEVGGTPDLNSSDTDVSINYVFKNFRFIHSQLAANPPTVVPRPTSSDPSDRYKADAADRLIRYGLRQYTLKEVFDQVSLNTLAHGTGFVKSYYDSYRGDILEFDQVTGEVKTEGDMCFSTPQAWDIWFDPDAASWPDVKWVFERIMMPYDEACYKFPTQVPLLEKIRAQRMQEAGTLGRSPLSRANYDVIEVYQYWERGLPHNGYIGRFCHLLEDGTVLDELVPNPHRFPAPKDKGIDMPEAPAVKRELPARAYLPYHIFTDVDVPNTPWGKAGVTYQAPLQDMHNRMVNVVIDNLQAHGVARIVLPEGTEIQDDSITNSPLDIIKVTGSQPPHFMAPMALPSESTALIQMMKLGIDDMAGVNENMFGQQSREQSSVSMQYATQQGNQIRHRLFVKYTSLVESVYKAYLNMIRKYWTTPRTINVLGKENAFEAFDIKGADIDGGFDLVVEYGASLSLDPTARREEMITLMPLFEKAGVEPRTLLSMLKLNELSGPYDEIQMAYNRQREIFEEMVAKQVYIAPRKISDHKNMLAYSYRYIMSSEFTYLEEGSKLLIEKHIEEREQLAAQGPAAQASAGGPLPASPAAPGGQLPGPTEQIPTTAATPQMLS